MDTSAEHRTPPSDPTLEAARRAQTGDEDALEQLILEVFPHVRAWVSRFEYRSAGGSLSTSDLAQSALANVVRAFRSGGAPTQDGASLKRWLKAVVCNSARDSIKRLRAQSRGVERTVELDAATPEGAPIYDAVADDPTVSTLMRRSEVLRDIDDAMACLNEREMDIIRAYFTADFSPDGACRELGWVTADETPTATMRKRVFRARANLRRHLPSDLKLLLPPANEDA